MMKSRSRLYGVINERLHDSGGPVLSVVSRGRLALFLVLLASPLFVDPAHAQIEFLRKTTPEQRADAQTNFMRKKLSLDEKTTALVSALNLETARKAQSSIEEASNRFSLAMDLRRINADRDVKLKALLSPAQWKVYESAQGEMKKVVLAELEKEVGEGP